MNTQITLKTNLKWLYEITLMKINLCFCLPLSHSNVQAVETSYRLRQKAPCSRSRSLPPLRSQRSGRWAPPRSLSLLKSPTDSRTLRDSYCPRTGRGRTGPWFWLRPLVDLHTLERNKPKVRFGIKNTVCNKLYQEEKLSSDLTLTSRMRSLEALFLYRVVREKSNEQLVAAGYDRWGFLGAAEAT